MASVYADPKLRSKRNYIAASTFSGVLYGYSTTLNTQTFNRTGALTVLPTSATFTNGNNKCVQGRILRETGAKLYPDANPGVSTLMVEIYDPNSGIRAYIDPNSPAFAVYNSDKPVEMTDGFEVGTSTAHKGQPVFTSGDVIAGGQIRSYTLTALPASGTNTVNFGVGQVYSITPTNNVTLNATTVPAVGSLVYVVVTTSGTTSYNITFGTNMKATNTNILATGTTTAKVFTVTFVSDGTNLNEVARTTAM